MDNRWPLKDLCGEQLRNVRKVADVTTRLRRGCKDEA